MTYIVIGIIVILCLLVGKHVLKIARAGREMKQLRRAGRLVKFAAWCKLVERYKRRYGTQAEVLGVAIVDQLFGHQHRPDYPAAAFAELNPELVRTELAALRDDADLLRMVHHVLSAEIVIRYAYGERVEQIEERFARLKEKGLLIPVRPVGTHEYLCLAKQFVNSNAPAPGDDS